MEKQRDFALLNKTLTGNRSPSSLQLETRFKGVVLLQVKEEKTSTRKKKLTKRRLKGLDEHSKRCKATITEWYGTSLKPLMTLRQSMQMSTFVEVEEEDEPVEIAEVETGNAVEPPSVSSNADSAKCAAPGPSDVGSLYVAGRRTFARHMKKNKLEEK